MKFITIRPLIEDAIPLLTIGVIIILVRKFGAGPVSDWVFLAHELTILLMLFLRRIKLNN